jgi:hypothetical protein
MEPIREEIVEKTWQEVAGKLILTLSVNSSTDEGN